MTSPGPVGDLPSVVSKAGAGRAREGQPKGEAIDGGGEKEAGFGELLSKLKGNDEAPAGDGRPARAAARSGERAGEWRPDVKTHSVAHDGDTVLDADAAGDAESVAMPEGSPQTQGMGGGTGAVNDLAAALGAAAAPVVTGSVAPGAQGSPTAPAPQSAEAALAALEAKAQAVDNAVTAAPAVLDAGQRAAASAANLGGQSLAGGKDKSADADALPAQPAIGAAAAPQANGATTPAPRAKATVVRQETHFAPVAPTQSPEAHAATGGETNKPGTGPKPVGGDAAAQVDATAPSFEGAPTIGTAPAQQIAERIATEAASTPSFTDRTATVPEQAGGKPVLKVLHISLQPVDLGTVTVRIEIKDAELTLHVEAERAETAEMIRNDQDTLSKLLRSAGYAVDAGAGIRVTDSAAAQPGQNNTQSNPQSSPQSHSGASDRQGQAQRGNDGSHNGNSGPQPNRNETNETSDIRAGGGVYI